jgi:protein N-terminal amidase
MKDNTKNHIKVLCIQFEPKYKDVKSNISHLEQMLSKYSEKDDIDIIIFPEMALSGYIFDNAQDIQPYMSLYNQGEQYEFVSNLSKRLKCYSFLGYAEVTQEGHYYNSCFIITPEGESLPSYRKHFLYTDDERWSLEGKNFGYIEITTKKGIQLKLGIGICMDINPYKFKSPFKKMEFANHCLNKNVDLIIFPTNWIDSEPNDTSELHKHDLWNYWMERMEPYKKKNSKNKKNVYMLCANRIGKEKTTTFHGCSCIMKIAPDFEVIAGAGLKEEAIVEATLNL